MILAVPYKCGSSGGVKCAWDHIPASGLDREYETDITLRCIIATLCNETIGGRGARGTGVLGVAWFA